MAFNPTFNDIVTAYNNKQRVVTDNNTEGTYSHYIKCVSVFGQVTQQVDGFYGGNVFESYDKSVKAEGEEGVRGINIPATLFITSDGVSLIFY